MKKLLIDNLLWLGVVTLICGVVYLSMIINSSCNVNKLHNEYRFNKTTGEYEKIQISPGNIK